MNEQNTNVAGTEQKQPFQEIHIDRALGNVVETKEELEVVTFGETRILNFTLACNNYTRKGEQPTASFLRVAAFDEDADILAKYLTKGKPLTVRGRIELKPYKSKKYFDASGNAATMLGAELRMEPRGFKFENGARRQAADQPAAQQQQQAAEPVAEQAAPAATTRRRSRKAPAAPVADGAGVQQVNQTSGPF